MQRQRNSDDFGRFFSWPGATSHGRAAAARSALHGVVFADFALSRVKLDRSIEALELKGLRLAVRHLRSGALIDRLRYENLVGFGDRLRPGGGVDDGADGCQVAVRPAELPKAEFTGMCSARSLACSLPRSAVAKNSRAYPSR